MAVIIVANGQKAVEAVSTGDFGLILMDIRMPIMDGLQATRAIRSAPRGANVPILAMTANAFEEDRQRCLLAGMSDHSAKPVEIDDLYTHLIAWLPIRRGELREDSSAHAVWSDFVVESCGSSDADAIELLRGIDGLDSRGQTATFNVSAITVYVYFAPIVTAFSLLRCDINGTASNVGTYIKYVLSVIFAPINNLNSKGGTVAYKVAGAPSYGTAVALNTISAYSTTVSGVIGGGAITSSGYMVQATLTDKYNSVPFEASLPSSKLWFDLHYTGEGMAIGKAATTPSLFDVGIDSAFREEATFEKVATFNVAPDFNAVPATLLALGIQKGVVATTLPDNNVKTGAVTFPMPYAVGTTPTVLLTPSVYAATYDRPLKGMAYNITNTGFSWMLSYASSSGNATNLFWLALGDL